MTTEHSFSCKNLPFRLDYFLGLFLETRSATRVTNSCSDSCSIEVANETNNICSYGIYATQTTYKFKGFVNRYAPCFRICNTGSNTSKSQLIYVGPSRINMLLRIGTPVMLLEVVIDIVCK